MKDTKLLYYTAGDDKYEQGDGPTKNCADNERV